MIEDTEKKNRLTVNPDFKEFLCNFITEAIAGMLVNAFQKKQNLKEVGLYRNLSIIISSLPDILRRAAI